jgi:hypothetical protein
VVRFAEVVCFAEAARVGAAAGFDAAVRIAEAERFGAARRGCFAVLARANRFDPLRVVGLGFAAGGFDPVDFSAAGFAAVARAALARPFLPRAAFSGAASLRDRTCNAARAALAFFLACLAAFLLAFANFRARFSAFLAARICCFAA